jgi:hypothetical protein
MTDPEPPALARWEAAPATPSWLSDLRRAAPVAIRRGGTVALVALGLGQLPPLIVNMGGADLAIATQLKIGWFYTVAANAASIRFGERSIDGGATVPVGFTTIRLAMLTFTLVLVWMIVRAGSASARRVNDAPARRAVAGALVGASYAIPLAILAPLVELRLRTDGGFLPDIVTVSAVIGEASAFPLVLGSVVGAFGGLHTTMWWKRGGGDALAGGWRTFAIALVASMVGLLAFAAVRPAGLDDYVEELRSLGLRGGAVAAGHQVLLLPNQATLILVASMGGCGSVAVDGERSDVLCLDRLPSDDNPLAWISTTLDDRPGSPTVSAPWRASLFLAVPLIAVILGVRRAVSGSGGYGRAGLVALGSALVFGALVFVATWASTVLVTSSQEREGVAPVTDRHRVELGAAPLTSAASAAAWGIVVGVPAAWAVTASRRRRTASPASPSPASPR